VEEDEGVEKGPEDDQPMSFFDHLAELRKRLLWAASSLMLGFIVCYVMVDQLTQLLLKPYGDAWWSVVESDIAEFGVSRLPDTGPRLQNLTAFESILTDIRIALIGGLFLAAPVVFYQIWMFISPGLYRREKKLVVPFSATSALMFALGAVFCYLLVLPIATEYLLTYSLDKDVGEQGVVIQANYTYTDYVKYVTRLLLGFGVVFQFPLAVFFLAKAGIITHKTLLRHWKIMVLSFFVIGALLTPPEPVSQMLMAMPMVVMFFASIGVAYLVSKPEVERMEKLEAELAEDADDDDDDL